MRSWIPWGRLGTRPDFLVGEGQAHPAHTPLWMVLSRHQLPLFSFTLGAAAPEPVIIHQDLSGEYMVMHLAFDHLMCQGVEFRWFGWAQTGPAVVVPAVLQLCTSFQM